ncbi:MAG TPA: protease pro-enzyme activation domain-containing protein [Candidatus Baltobacteraceae bacterium]|jgi:subtilase family serine protease
MIRTTSRALGAILTAALLFAGCGGGGSHSSLPAGTGNPNSGNNGSTGNNNSTGPTSLVYGQAFISKLSYVGPVTKAAGMTIPVLVRQQNAAGLIQYAKSASDPTSGNYRHWLTPAQIGAQYGATANDYANAATYLKSFGLKVGGWSQRQVLSVTGTTTQLAKAFGTTFGVYNYAGRQYIAASSAPHLPSTVAIAAAPLVQTPGCARNAKTTGFQGPCATGAIRSPYIIQPNLANFYGYGPQQMATGFDYSGAYSAGFKGSGITVGIIGTGPILAANGKSDDAAALGLYWNAPMATITQVATVPQAATAANGGTGTGASDNNPTNFSNPPPVTNPNCNPGTNVGGTFVPNYAACNPEDGEAQLDTQSIASLAPGSNLYFYMAYNSNEFCIVNSDGSTDPTLPVGPTCPTGETPYPLEGIDLSDDEIQQAIADNKADAVSMSFGGPENLNEEFGYIQPSGSPPGLGQIEMASMAAEGVAVFVSSGDDGAWECFDDLGNPLGTACASYPASDPNVVAVGGVNIPLDQAGNLTGTITAWADNTTTGGNGTFGNNVGSGGGVSAVFTAPSWQASALSASMRLIPDWSLDADPLTGPAIFINVDYGGGPEAIGGTSASAPASAALWALVLQACKASATCNTGGTTGYRLGNPAPLIYAIYANNNSLSGAYTASGFTPKLDYAHVFYDVTYGDNQAAPVPGPAQTPIGYNSGPGYDQVTGVGAPFAGHLIQAVTGTTVP